ncbi:MAG: Peptidase M24 [uncultured Campylobacterales bacterium]|uniref:Peptidase M24 n=1 Tax=uncultured Campylobacterales bacterium TaxID=352960 RepID=A0A6S6TAJ6_9BACT|nr:MAG: Peptidase M24 [uncultured Campylobacterales bacterium]
MKHRFTVTISDLGSTKSYTLLQVVKKYLIALLVIFLVSIFIIVNVIKTFNDQVISLKSDVDQITNKKQNVLQEYNEVLEQLNLKSVELNNFKNELSEIETLVGLKEIQEDQNLTQRLAELKVGASLQNIIFELIPSGSPIKYSRITSSYGNRYHPIKKRQELHKGIDLKARIGVPIHAPADGIVRYTKRSKFGYGNVIILSHNYGFETLYGHLKSIGVKEYQHIKKGDVIGLVGNSGMSTGSHLHYEVKFGLRTLNPIYFMNWNRQNFNEIFTKERRLQWENLIKRIKQDFRQILQ